MLSGLTSQWIYYLLCIASKAYPIVLISNNIVFSFIFISGIFVILSSKSSYSVKSPALPG